MPLDGVGSLIVPLSVGVVSAVVAVVTVTTGSAVSTVSEPVPIPSFPATSVTCAVTLYVPSGNVVAPRSADQPVLVAVPVSVCVKDVSVTPVITTVIEG